GAGPTDDDDVKRRGRLTIEIRAQTVAHQGRGQAHLAGLHGQFGVAALPAVLLQPAEVLGQLARQGPMADALPDRGPGIGGCQQVRHALYCNGSYELLERGLDGLMRSRRKASSGTVVGSPSSVSLRTSPVAADR